MKGHKWDLFIFDLSYIGWFFLVSLTCGILIIYVYPYYTTARSAFIADIAKENGLNIDK